MATSPSPRDFSDFLRSLEDEDVEYLLIGGYAVGYYGYPRATADMRTLSQQDTETREACGEAVHRPEPALQQLLASGFDDPPEGP
jgi:hypothetical protein